MASIEVRREEGWWNRPMGYFLLSSIANCICHRYICHFQEEKEEEAEEK